MVQNRRSELPPLKDPRTIANSRRKGYARQEQRIDTTRPVRPPVRPQGVNRATPVAPPLSQGSTRVNPPGVKKTAPSRDTKVQKPNVLSRPPASPPNEVKRPEVSAPGKPVRPSKETQQGGKHRAPEKPAKGVKKPTGGLFKRKQKEESSRTKMTPGEVRSALASKVHVAAEEKKPVTTEGKTGTVSRKVEVDKNVTPPQEKAPVSAPKSTPVSAPASRPSDNDTKVQPVVIPPVEIKETQPAPPISIPPRESERDIIVETEEEDDSTLDDETQEENTSNGKMLLPKKNIDTKKHKVPFWKIFVNFWVVGLVIAFSVLGSIGYSWWNDMALQKEKDASYHQGFVDAYAEPSVETVIRNTPEEIDNLILRAPNNGYPTNAVLSDYSLVGWSIPGGIEGHGRASLEVCYTGDGVPEKLLSKVYLVSDNADAQKPYWYVDSVDVTGELCQKGAE